MSCRWQVYHCDLLPSSERFCRAARGEGIAHMVRSCDQQRHHEECVPQCVQRFGHDSDSMDWNQWRVGTSDKKAQLGTCRIHWYQAPPQWSTLSLVDNEFISVGLTALQGMANGLCYGLLTVKYIISVFVLVWRTRSFVMISSASCESFLFTYVIVRLLIVVVWLHCLLLVT